MIKELEKAQTVHWDEKIKLEMSLSDLQIIYDCIGAIPIRYLKEKHKNTNFEIKYYNSQIINDLYEELENIISKYNGITDSNKNVNIIHLDITEEN